MSDDNYKRLAIKWIGRFFKISFPFFLFARFTGHWDTFLHFQIRGGDGETDQAPLFGAGDRGGVVMGRQGSGDGQVPRAAASPSAGPVHIRP